MVRSLILGALVAALVAVQGVPLASGEEDDHPVGYTIGRAVPAGSPSVEQCDFYRVDLTTGAATQVNPTGTHVRCGDGLTFDDDETLYAYRNPPVHGPGVFAELVTIDLKTGAQHVVGSLPRVLVGDGGMTFDEDGNLWLYSFSFDAPCTPGRYCLWKVDPDDASTTLVGIAPPGQGVFGLTADCDDVIAITATPPDGFAMPARLDEVNTKTAGLAKIVDLPGFGFPTGLDFEDDGDLWAIGVIGPGRGAGIGAAIFRIDPSDGTFQIKDITVNGVPFNGELDGLAVDAISCEDPGPEPTPPPAPTPVAVEPVFTG